MAEITPTNMDDFYTDLIDGTGPDPWGHEPVAAVLHTGLAPMRPVSSRRAAKRYRRARVAAFHSTPDDSVARGLVAVMGLLAFVCLCGLIAIWVATGMGVLR